MGRSLTISLLFSFRQQLLKLYFSHLCHLRHKLRLCRCCHCKYPKFRCFYMVLSKHFLHWALFHFNPLPPCGGRRGTQSAGCRPRDFNPLPPCGGRHLACIASITLRLFQSTPSVWRETKRLNNTHTLHHHFNPLPPCGGRHPQHRKPNGARRFQSTPSVWRETALK